MDLTVALARYSHALGRWQAAWRFAAPDLRRAVAVAQVSAAWDVFRRDAGPGDVGRAHDEQPDRSGVTLTDDPRRDGVLLWLADYGISAIAEAAGLLARMVGAIRPLGAEEQELLQAARDTPAGGARPGPLARSLPPMDDGDDLLASLRMIAAAIDQLRADPAFLESAGSEVRHRLPRGMLRHFVPAEPGAAWALNLALLASGAGVASAPAVPGLVSRALFRADVDLEELVAALVDSSTRALDAAYVRIATLRAELDCGDAALAHLSRNARAPDAWRLIAALGTLSRAQLARALAVSRAGADIQAHALAKADLVSLEPGGRIVWQPYRAPNVALAQKAEEADPSAAFAEFDTGMADIDRLLPRGSPT